MSDEPFFSRRQPKRPRPSPDLAASVRVVPAHTNDDLDLGALVNQTGILRELVGCRLAEAKAFPKWRPRLRHGGSCNVVGACEWLNSGSCTHPRRRCLVHYRIPVP